MGKQDEEENNEKKGEKMEKQEEKYRKKGEKIKKQDVEDERKIRGDGKTEGRKT